MKTKLPEKDMISDKVYVLYEGFLFQIVGTSNHELTIIRDGARVHIPAREAKYCSLAEFLKMEV